MKNFSQYILMDNYRGFSKTAIPLGKTNFFVGENSTGKSSVLGLIQILTNYTFWYTKPEFKSEETSFSHSSDIISANSSNQSTFGVGYLNNNNKKTRDDDYFFTSGFYITFKDKNGSPEPLYFSIGLGKEKLLTIKYETKSVSYKISNNFSLNANTLPEAQLLLKNLIDSHDGPTGFTKFSTNPIRGLFDVVLILRHELRKQSRDEVEYPLEIDLMPNIRPVWLAPIRSKPRRTYDEPSFDFSPEGEHTPYLINMILSSRKNDSAKSILEKVGREAGLFKEVALKKYGRTKNAPFELDFVIDEVPLSILNVGYGVSQSIPIIAEMVMRPKNSFFIIQQPEVHLHPKAQAAIGTLLFNSASNGNSAIVETHSDYMIDRFRILKRKQNAKKIETVLGASQLVDSQIVFFMRKDGFNTASSIVIDQSGDLEEDQPSEYRDFFINEQVDLLGL